MPKKVTIITIVLINVVLAATLVTLYFTTFKLNRNSGKWTLTIKGNIEQEIVLTRTDLENMPSLSREYFLQGNPTFYANYTGIRLWYLLTEVANVSGDVDFRVTAIDKYSYSMNLERDLSPTSEIIIAYKKNGNYLKERSKGGEGPLRLIIPQRFEGEWNGQYCVKYVAEIEILN